jgi:hypothetical protein
VPDKAAPRTCIFCGATPLTAEHIWPGWARRMLPPDLVVPHTVSAEMATAEPTSRTFPQRVFDQTAKVVCASCNNGWMEQLETRNRPFLEAALNGRGRALHRSGQRSLAAWAFKTALVINYGLFRAHRTGLPLAYTRHLLDTGEPPPEVGIWMTAFTADEPARVISTGLALSKPGERVTDNDPPNFSVVTFTFGPLAFQVAGGHEFPSHRHRPIRDPVPRASDPPALAVQRVVHVVAQSGVGPAPT